MLVSDIIKQAFSFLDMEEYAQKLAAGGDADDAEYVHAQSAMLHCFNAVEDELSRGYFPLTYAENITVSGEKFYFSSLAKTPVKILSFKKDGRAAKFSIEPEYIAAKDGCYVVEYTFCPEKKTIDGSSDYDGYPVGGRLIAYGICAEYCLITGAYEASECWEGRYVREIERLRRPAGGGFISARSWA